MSAAHVIPIRSADLEWPFESSMITFPRFRSWDGKYSRSVLVDPTPCYPHPQPLVEELVRQVTLRFPLSFDVYFYVPEYEVLERVNGWAAPGSEHEKIGEQWVPRNHTSSIILSGKKIPLHPAMTRYLVAHEYGHLVEMEIRQRLGIKRDNNEEWDTLYRALRPNMPEEPKYYGARTWHLTTGEIFANDFRILIAEQESEFWPHAGIVRPDDSPKVMDFWLNHVKALFPEKKWLQSPVMALREEVATC